MTFDNHNKPQPPIQVLVTSCAAIDEPHRCAWLHGFALLTLQPSGTDVMVTGKVALGERYGDDRPVIEALATALNPAALLAGNDLTEQVARLGKLPLGAKDQVPSLALLETLQGMIEHHVVLDLSVCDDGPLMLAIKSIEHGLPMRDDDDDESIDIRLVGSPDNLNPARLAAELADSASAIALAIGEIYLDIELRQPLLENWRRWRSHLRPRLLPKSDDQGDAPTP